MLSCRSQLRFYIGNQGACQGNRILSNRRLGFEEMLS
jgi:hypothetical protein